MLNVWSIAWRAAAFRRALFASLFVAAHLVFLLPVFFAHIDAKPGWWPPDPVIARVGPVDVTWFTFAVLYGGIIFTVVRLARDPWLFVRGLHAYTLLQILRMAAMATITLEPPMRIIPLVDPITTVFYPSGTPFSKDLFFSGHTATLALMAFLSRGRAARWAMIVATIAIGALVLVQHVHWTIDVLAAPAFVLLAWSGSAFTVRWCGAATV